MAGKKQMEWPPDDQLLSMVDSIGPSETARRLGRSRGSIAHHVRRIRSDKSRGPEQPGVAKFDDGSLSITSDPSIDPPAPWNAESLLAAHGLSVDDWVIVRVRANRWGEPDDPRHQLRVDVVPKQSLVILPDQADWQPLPKPKRSKKTDREPTTTVVMGDHHCPHHDKTLHALAVEYLTDAQPDEIIINGDLLDFSTISRHRQRDGYAQPVNDCLRAAWTVLRDYRHAAPDSSIVLMRGNHDDRLVHQILDHTAGLHRITPADDAIPALSLRRLLHLDDLHVELVDEDWDRAKYRLSKRLTVRHGYATGKNATDKMLTSLNHSTIQGHTHRLSLLFRTEHDDADPSEPTVTRLGAEAGCMCEIEDGLGYVTGGEPDWQRGFLVISKWQDDDFLVSPAVYVPGRLMVPNGRRYVAG